ncbi:MAG: alpha-amylase family glycosyl hydrolase [Bacteroidales bacterium]
MKQQIALGNFKPTTDFVDVSGSFNSWGSAKFADGDGDSIYTVSVALNVGDNIEFKARINGLWNGLEEFPGGGANRTYSVVLNGVVSFWYSDVIPSNILSTAIQASNRTIIPGQAVQFTDKSNGSPVSWEWTFMGGTPTTSNVQNPLITYPEEGKYQVTLKIKNIKGDSISKIFANYINVSKVKTYWWNDAVFYEVFVRSFYDQNGDGKGDLKGLTAKLDYLNDGDSTTHTDLGITGIWLMPIMQSPSYHGYDVADYRTVESDYGTNADFAAFIQAAHQRGIKVIIDLVMNHTSNQNSWFTQSASSTNSTYRDWYRWNTTNPGGSWNYKNSAYYYAVFGSGMPDLNYAVADVKTEMFDIARFWLQDMHADGFRLDAVKYIFETSTQIEDVPATFQFWQDFRTSYKSVNPDAFAVGEAWTSTSIIKKYVENNGLDYCFEFSLANALVNTANNGDATGLKIAIENSMASFPYLQFGTFLTNHDQERVMTTFGNDISKAKLAAGLLLSLPGIPYIYYGEEIGTVGPKPDENIRTPLQWDNTRNAGFSSGTAWRAPQTDYTTKNIAAQQADINSLCTMYKKMIQLRNAEPALRRGNYVPIISNYNSAFTFLRQYNDETILVASNVSNLPLSNVEINLYPGTLTAGSYQLKDLLTGTLQQLVVGADGGATAQNIGNLSARTTAIYKVIASPSGFENSESSSFNIFPIPANDNIFIQLDNQMNIKINVTISDMSGKVLKNKQITGSTSLSVNDLLPGFYVVKATDGTNSQFRKIVIER